MTKGKRTCAIFILCAMTATASLAQTFTTMLDFDGKNGASPYFMSLVQGADGNLYGTTEYGGADSHGTIFKITPGGALSMRSFNGTNGANPYSGLLLATDGNFYGTTDVGGANGLGTIFKITRRGTLTTLYSFCAQPPICADGAEPSGGLVQGTDGNFYGTTVEFGDNHGGTVFKVSAAGTVTPLYSFCAQLNCTDGHVPEAGLVQASDGNFYGTTFEGGNTTTCEPPYGCGTIFKITRAGRLTILHRFDDSDGRFPFAGLLQATDGNLYGATEFGGGGAGCLPNAACGGTIFKVTLAGELTTLYSFCGQTNCTDGDAPTAGLVQGTDGNFYGTTFTGGAYGDGTVFEITSAGTLTTLHSFNATDGGNPQGGLLQATNGILYGTTSAGGANSEGTVFSLDMGLGPFVSLVRYSGRVGYPVGILGQGFTGTTNVSLNGTAASFTVESDTYLTAKVPSGATTGFVTVTTPSGTLTSNQIFRVKP